MANDYEVKFHEGTKSLIKYNGNEQNIILPDDIEVVGENAFAECNDLISVKLPERLKTIEAYAFANCTSLTSLNIPGSVNGIGFGEFWNCNKLSFLIIPKGIKSVDRAFQWCEELEIRIYYHHEASEPSSIEGFRNRYINLLDEENKRISKLFILDERKDKPEEEFSSRLMSGLVNHLSEYDAIFSSIDEIVIRKARAAICRLEYPLELLNKYKKSYINYLKKHSALLIPFLIKEEDVASVSLFCAVGAISLENINDFIEMANKLSRNEILALLLDYKNKTVVQESRTVFELDSISPTNDWVTQMNEDGTLTITKYLGKDLDVIILATVNSKQVKGIEGNLGSLKVSVFFPNENLVQSVTIQEGLEVVGERAFLECRNLKSVALPGSITTIGKEAFAWCHTLTSVVIPKGVESIGEGAFENCLSLSSLHIPASVEKIGKNAFTSIGNRDEVLPNLVIHSPKGSYAIEYAKNKGIKYVET